MEGLNETELLELTHLLNLYVESGSERHRAKILALILGEQGFGIIWDGEVMETKTNLEMEMEIEMDGVTETFPLKLFPEGPPFFYHGGSIFCVSMSLEMKRKIDGIFMEFGFKRAEMGRD